MPDLGNFGLEFQKSIVIFEISTLKFVKNESLSRTMNFGIGSAFSKGLESAFSEGPGLLYKVCGTYNIYIQYMHIYIVYIYIVYIYIYI